MNVLECFIKQIHSEKNLGNGFVEVDVTSVCWGSVERKKKTFSVSDWSYFKQQGYYYE